MNCRQACNKLHRLVFLDDKTNSHKHNIHGPKKHDIFMQNPLNAM